VSTIQRIRPDGTVSTVSITLTGGAADADDALRRTSVSDQSKAQQVNFNAGTSDVIVDNQSIPVLGATQRICRLRIRVGVGAIAGSLAASLRSAAVNVQSLLVTNVTTDYTEFNGNWINVNPNGSVEWTEAAVNAVQQKLNANGNAGMGIFWADVEVDERTRPTVSIISPAAGALVARDGFLVKWNFTAAGDAASKYQVKVFTAAVAEGAGFDPETSANVYGSGVQTPSSGSYQHQVSPTSIFAAATDHYVYVKSASLFNGGTNPNEQWYSQWVGRKIRTVSVPVMTVTAPTGAIATSQPTITYTLTDADGKVPIYLHFRIFEQPGGTWTGFDPDNTAVYPTWEAIVGDPNLFTGSWPLDYPALANTKTYRCYVKAVYSGSPPVIQNFSDFTTFWTNPATPTFTVTPQPDTNSRVQLAVRNNENHASVRVTIERSLDGGASWVKVRGANSVNIGFNVTTNFYDYEAPPRTSVMYRVWCVSSGSGFPLQSLPATATVTINARWVFLCDPINPARNMHTVTQGSYVDRNRSRRRTFYEAIGRTKPVVMRGLLQAESFTMNFLARNPTEEAALILLLDSDRTLLLRTPRKMTWVEVAGDYTDSEYLWADLHGSPAIARLFTVPFIEVDSVP
jgi:hypothetical protein